MTKFIRILIIVNGLIIPTIFLAGLLLWGIKTWNNNEDQPGGIIVGEKFDQAAEKNIALQGLEYGSPQKTYNSNALFMPISIMTYKEAMEMHDAISSANSFGYSMMRLSNVLFLDSTFNNTHWLLDEKASIKDLSIRHPSGYDDEIDTNYCYLSFEIGFEDSNKDGLLNWLDFHDLYISDVNGKNLKKITSEIDVIDYEFRDQYKTVFIKYTERNDSVSEEHKLVKFGKYHMNSEQFVEYNSLNETILEYRTQMNKK